MKWGRVKKIVLVAVVIYLVWKFLSGLIGGPETAGADHLINQLWIERLPKDQRDHVHHVLLAEIRKQHFGHVGYSSAFHIDSNAVQWRIERDTLTLHYMQADKVRNYRVRTWDCGREAPKPFNICLELDGDGKRERYYSRDDWKIRDMPSDAPPLVIELAKSLSSN
jgi:hypothetical protein